MMQFCVSLARFQRAIEMQASQKANSQLFSLPFVLRTDSAATLWLEQ